jgi:hypothetical protein
LPTGGLDVDLEEVAQVVQARRREAQRPLLLHRGRLGVALDDHQPAQVGAVLAGHLLPRRVAAVVTEADAAIVPRVGEEDAPAIVGHLDIAEVGPAVLADGDGGTQVDVVVLEGDRPQLLPPVDEAWLPRLEGPSEATVTGEVNVVGDRGVDVDGSHCPSPHVRSRS